MRRVFHSRGEPRLTKDATTNQPQTPGSLDVNVSPRTWIGTLYSQTVIVDMLLPSERLNDVLETNCPTSEESSMSSDRQRLRMFGDQNWGRHSLSSKLTTRVSLCACDSARAAVQCAAEEEAIMFGLCFLSCVALLPHLVDNAMAVDVTCF